MLLAKRIQKGESDATPQADGKAIVIYDVSQYSQSQNKQRRHLLVDMPGFPAS